jgi:hypothetical protein
MNEMDVTGSKAEGCMLEGGKEEPRGNNSQKVGNAGAGQAGKARQNNGLQKKWAW